MPFSIAGPASPALPSLDGINRAADRLSSGLRTDFTTQTAEAAITGRLDTLKGESTVTVKNAINQLSALQRADQTLSQATELTERIQKLAVRSGNGALSEADKLAIQNESKGLIEDIGNLVDQAQYNGESVFESINLDIGDLKDQIAQINPNDLDQSELVGIQEELSGLQAELGGQQNGLQRQIDQALDSQIQLADRGSQISDADLAIEVANLIQEQINFEASVKVFNQQRLAESSIINLLN